MALFTIQRNGFTKVSEMMQQVVNDMADHGFNVILPTAYDAATPLVAPFKFVLDATVDVDPLAATQPWRICINVTDDQVVSVFVATPIQIADDGSISPVTDAQGATQFLAGQIGKQVPAVLASDPSTGFVNRQQRVTASASGSFPLNYRLSITDRGFFLGSFEGNWASVIFQPTVDAYMNWMLVQRPVNKQSGETLVVGKCPVFCVNKVNDAYWRFVVRESDIPHPTPAVIASEHTEDNFRIINIQNQISLTEDKTYLVSFMNNLNTPRFRYTEELDIIGVVSSDVVMESVPLQLTAYGSPRSYVAMPGSDDFNTGVRILILTGVNEAPTNITLSAMTIADGANTASDLQVASIVVTDSGAGTNEILVSGADAPSFKIVGTNLLLKAGVIVNKLQKASYSISITARDTVEPTFSLTKSFTITVV